METSDLCQFACDMDGDLFLFPAQLDSDYVRSWQITLISEDGTRTIAKHMLPTMSVIGNHVSNPLSGANLMEIAGWQIDYSAIEIEVAITNRPTFRISNPWR